jgi:chromosome segregation ATPase
VLEKHREFDQQTIKLHEDDLNDRTRNIKAECQQKANDEMRKLRNDHEREIADVKSRYECRIKELQSTIAQRSEIAKSLQEHGSSEVSNLIKRVAEITEKHSKDLRAMREKYEAELAEESSAKSTLKASLRELESKNEDLEEALKSAISKGTKSTQGESKKCDDCVELKNKLQEHAKRESKLRGELAQSKQLMTITQANEKLLEEHVKQLEAQIDTLVLDYEGKLRH